MAECIECDNFDGKHCEKPGFVAKCPNVHLECEGYVFTKKWNCLENYEDLCEHREVCDVPFSADWCRLKHTHCDNNKLNLRRQ